MLWAGRLWNIPMMLEVVFFLPLWRDVLEYTCLLGYRGEEVNWFSVEKKSGLNAVRRTQFPWLPRTHWSPRSGCVLMNIKLSTDRLARVAVFMLLCPIQSNLNDKNTNVWNQRALAIMAHITRSLRQQLHAHTQTRTHSLRVQCCCCTIKRGRYRDDGPSIRGELGRTGKPWQRDFGVEWSRRSIRVGSGSARTRHPRIDCHRYW